jgi:hypothetical protein
MPWNRCELQQERNVTALPKAIFLPAGGDRKGVRLAIALGLFLTLTAAMRGWAAGSVQLGHDTGQLPAAVQRMRQAILRAAATGDIEGLRVPIEMNEIQPVFTKSHVKDPIAHLKSVSADGNGREILAILVNLLTTGYAIVNAGTKDEAIVWPYHAVIPLSTLTPGQEVELYRFVPPARLKEMIAKGKYSYYSVGIGRDGVWHYFSFE